jgi:DNA-directed RNA polymerase beta subunit
LAEAFDSGARVYVNGEIAGLHDNPSELVAKLRRLRRAGSIRDQVNVAYFEETHELFMNTDSGRARRPMIVAENGRALVTEEHTTKIRDGEMTFEDLVAAGLVEYLDAEANGTYGGSQYFPGFSITSEAEIVTGQCSLPDFFILSDT